MLVFFQSDPTAEIAMMNSVTVLLGLAFIGLLPLVLGLLSYFLAGGIGNSWFSIIFITLVIGMALLLQVAVVIDFLLLTGNAQKFEGLALFGLYSCIILSPIVFTVTAFIVGEVTAWRRIIPIVAFVLFILLPVTFGIIAVAIVSYSNFDESGNFYRGVSSTVIPQWLLLGSIAWSLLGLPAFVKDKNVADGRIKIPPSPQEHFVNCI